MVKTNEYFELKDYLINKYKMVFIIMTHDSLVCINIYNKKTKELYNKRLVPILFYWNGEYDLIDNIIKSEDFKSKYLDKIEDYDKFKNLQISYFYFKFNEETSEEEYCDSAFDIIEHILLKDFDSNNIIFKLVMPYFYSLYKMSIKVEYDKVNVFNEDIIIDIYKKIKEIYKDKILKETLINWVRSKLIDDIKINSENVNFIVNKLNNILKNED